MFRRRQQKKFVAASFEFSRLAARRNQKRGLRTRRLLSVESLEPRNLMAIVATMPVYEGPGQQAQPELSGSGGAITLPQPLSQTFFLHSNPGAEKVIYLDFDSHFTQNTLWNDPDPESDEDVEIGTIFTPPYSIDDVGSFSAQELFNIQEMWARVAEDFAPFDVDVTTEDPGETFNGIRAAVGGSNDDWLDQDVGGIAYILSFGSDTPVFVFDEQTGNGDPKATAEAISHEVGHSLGLFHWGQVIVGEDEPQEYY
jgi:hypothetical protein